MTLAVLVLFAHFFGMSAPVLEARAQQSASAPNSQVQDQSHDQTKPAGTSEQPPSTTESKKQTSAKPKQPAKRSHKQKSVNSDCNSSKSSSAGASTQAAPSATATNCPPPKIVIREGGTTDPSIQLAGGPTADEAARKRNAISQLLDTTEQNLKKAAEKQLTGNQQDTVSQTRQFMQESKQAMADGDLERARTLAWKAEVLSEDLVNPQK